MAGFRDRIRTAPHILSIINSCRVSAGVNMLHAPFGVSWSSRYDDSIPSSGSARMDGGEDESKYHISLHLSRLPRAIHFHFPYSGAFQRVPKSDYFNN